MFLVFFDGSKTMCFLFLLKNGASKFMYTFLQVASLKQYVFYYKWPQIKQFKIRYKACLMPETNFWTSNPIAKENFTMPSFVLNTLLKIRSCTKVS